MSENDNRDVALKAWEIYQNLAKGMGESAWKIRSVCFTLNAALVAYSYTSSAPLLYLVASVLSVMFFLMESGYRRLQDQYIEKSIAIELTLNDFIANESDPRFPESIGTDLSIPSFDKFIKLFALKRIIFWMPYIVIFFAPIILYFLDFKKIDTLNNVLTNAC